MINVLNEPRYTSLAWSSVDGNPRYLDRYLGAWDYRVYRGDLLTLLADYPFVIVLQLVDGMPQEYHVYCAEHTALKVQEAWSLNRYTQVKA